MERAVIRLGFGCILGGLLGAALGGCAKSQIRSYEGQACSIDPDEDPQRTCSPAADLVCIATYAHPMTARPVHVCRFVCDPSEGCRNADEVCCPGQIYGRTYGKSAACVLARWCDSIAPAGDGGTDRLLADLPRDGGADASPDDAPAPDGAPPDAGVDDAAVDAEVDGP